MRRQKKWEILACLRGTILHCSCISADPSKPHVTKLRWGCVFLIRATWGRRCVRGLSAKRGAVIDVELRHLNKHNLNKYKYFVCYIVARRVSTSFRSGWAGIAPFPVQVKPPTAEANFTICMHKYPRAISSGIVSCILPRSTHWVISWFKNPAVKASPAPVVSTTLTGIAGMNPEQPAME